MRGCTPSLPEAETLHTRGGGPVYPFASQVLAEGPVTCDVQIASDATIIHDVPCHNPNPNPTQSLTLTQTLGLTLTLTLGLA